ncbi:MULTISPECIES: enoyl-CoA hydratase [unclassified Undibacterium]|uniref:enoyl-CoA hydratase n=1 Tax=unclassified Undibacterium TaxID=2630295 RepID=UPI002AC9E610|nr:MULTISPECIES: enoyl-CoA hydratase [unclassified Undibacterium]MEB0138641.1 enoyl-CoA hydratase [Undibacterium sp. CCC2.1]MEB0171442.1 enoyl-CoA hydratase [Undibacterium sp. CCC1.1]MEB0175772.1 enoyl-CoA hydratase [Undibacterium sp. CCC3.4]MEB0214400.1 enoyl-CoA hydratase [Undibacterium sp. 5I2]WPX44267.1 enoyl-CoA hydratase [Undibacterium sp. CCC3.4]
MDILTQTENGILTINFNRPEKKNAITAAMYQSMADALRAAETDVAVRVILITGKPEIFTAGNDLEDFVKNAGTLADPHALPPVYQFMQALNDAGKPVIAAVSGAAVGIGTTLLMHCDLIYLADNARLSMPFTQLGLCPEFGSSLVFQQIVGYQRAAEKLMLGEAFNAEEAFQMGFVNKVLPLAELLPYALQQAAKFVALPAASVRATKRLMKGTQPAAIATKMDEENRYFAAMLNAPEAKEAFMAFFQKRKPDFTKFD